MFMGVKSFKDVRPVRCFEDAVKALEACMKTPTGRIRIKQDRGYPMGAHSKSVTWVRPDNRDGSIAFQLYDTDVVTWHPDNSFTLDNYGTKTTSEFAGRFTPHGIWLRYEAQQRGQTCGDLGIEYVLDPEHLWHDRHICFGRLVTFRQQDNGAWVPDANTCDDHIYPALDRSQSRAVGRKYRLRDFENWLAMAPLHMDLEHSMVVSTEACAEALLAGDFRKAAECLPLITIGSGFGIADRIKPLRIATTYRDKVVTMTSLAKLRIALLVREGALGNVARRTLSLKDYDRRMRLTRELDALWIGPSWWM